MRATGEVSANDGKSAAGTSIAPTPAEEKKETTTPATRNKEETMSKEQTKSRLSTMSRNGSQKSMIPQAPERDNLDGDFKPVIIKLWQDLAKNYKGQMKFIFRNIRMQREQRDKRIANTTSDFLNYLHTHDGK